MLDMRPDDRTPDDWLALAAQAEADGNAGLAREYEDKALAAEQPKEPPLERLAKLMAKRVEERESGDLRYQFGDKTFTKRWEPNETESEPGEEWRDIQGYEGVYMVSSHGRVWSIPRISTTGDRRVGGRVIAGGAREDLRWITLVDKDGQKHAVPLAALVLETFMDWAVCPEHKDGDTRNCRLDNLVLRKPSERRRNSFTTVRKAIKPKTVVVGRQRPLMPVLDRTHVRRAENAPD